MNWEILLADLKRECYTQLLMEATCILVFITYFIKKADNTIYLFLLSLASLVQTLSVQFAEIYLNSILFNASTKISITIYTACEITFCLQFIKTYIHNGFVKKTALFCNIGFISVMLYLILSRPATRKMVSDIGISEGFIIICFCLYYFYELTKRSTNESIFRMPEFWAISGMLLLFSVIEPLFIALDFLKRNNWLLSKQLYIINYISYSVLFITFTISILQNKKKDFKTPLAGNFKNELT